MLSNGTSVTEKQPPHLTNFVMKKISVKPLNRNNLAGIEKIYILNLFLMTSTVV